MELTDAQKQSIVQIGRNVSDTCDWYLKMCYGVPMPENKQPDMMFGDQQLKDEIKNHPEQLYQDRDTELRDMMNRWSKDMDGDFRVQAMQIASTLPNGSLAELIDNTERVMKWLEVKI